MNSAADWLFDAGVVLVLSVVITGVWWMRGHRSRLWLLTWLYLATLMVLTTLPLPDDPASWCARRVDWSNLVPGGSLVGIADLVAAGRSWRAGIYAVQVVLNIVLFMPFGALLEVHFGASRRLLSRRCTSSSGDAGGLPPSSRVMYEGEPRPREHPWATLALWTLIGYAVSCLIELTQWTGLYGVVPCSYRIADVDDVIMNTLGTFAGVVAVRTWWKGRTP
ncbi:VanZ family protein [Schaalia vaccimaxillae]|uniref:VanZ family protein n=1 Tax=Schaalia vaccimaxillae TaxID=183916 RepID=UPI0003B7729B|nr:VanZ family protein [Schaalia vaccimaxillae]